MNQAIQLLCSTGAFSRFPDKTGYQAALEYGPQLAVDGFELMFYPGWYGSIERIANNLGPSGLHFPALHADKDIGILLGKPDAAKRAQGIHNLAENCQLAKLLGAKLLVLHLWGWPELDDALERNLALLSACLDVAAEYATELAIETIPCHKFTPLDNIKAAVACDRRSQVALDTEFLTKHNQLDEVFAPQWDWLWQEGYVRHIHIKDSDGQPFSIDGKRRYLHPGDGAINFTLFFEQLKQRNFTGNVSLEAPAIDHEGTVSIHKLHTSLHLLRTLIDA